MPANKKETTKTSKKPVSSGKKSSVIDGNKKKIKNTSNQDVSKNTIKKSSILVKTSAVKKRVSKSPNLKTKANNTKTSPNSSKKNRSVNKKKESYALSYFILIALVSISSIIVIYIFHMFPKKIAGEIKKTLVSVYNPIIFEDTDATILIKLKKKPDNNENYEFYERINNEYGFEAKFEKIAAIDDKGINKITFYKNGRKNENINDVYIYWDEKSVIDGKKIVTNDLKNNAEKSKISNDKNAVQKNEKLKEYIEIKKSKEMKLEKKEKSITENSPVKNEVKNIAVKKKEKPKVENSAKICIIIDDVGYAYGSTEKFLALGFPLTFAIIPDMPLSDKYYEMITAHNYDVIAHIPMEPQKGRQYVEKNGLFTDMTDSEIKSRVEKIFAKYPKAIGANNHMGSKAVTDGKLMNALISVLAENNKIWIDSMTNHNSLSKEMTAIYKMPYYDRDVFLDNEKDVISIRKSMDRLVYEAKRNKFAIGIGHAQSDNLAVVLKEYYDKRDALGIEFVDLK